MNTKGCMALASMATLPSVGIFWGQFFCQPKKIGKFLDFIFSNVNIANIAILGGIFWAKFSI